MFGIKGVPFTDSFEWGRWSRSARQLRAQGATEVLTDQEAAQRGYALKAAKSYALSKSKVRKTSKSA